MRKLFAASLSLVLLIPASNALAEMPTAQFLMYGEGSRAEAMGRSVVANCRDYSSLYWNPAQSAYLKNPVIGLSSARITPSIMSSYLAFIYPKEKYVYGVQVLGESSRITAYNSMGDEIPSTANLNYKINTTISRKFGNNLAVGVGIGAVKMQLGDYQTNYAVNIDAGTTYTNNRFSAGLVAANIGNNLAFERSGEAKEVEEHQPTLIRCGAAYYLFKDRSLLGTISAQNVILDNTAYSYGMGLEYVFLDYFAVRAGALVQNNGLKPTTGFGIDYNRLSIEYSFTLSPIEMLGLDQSKVSFAYRFGGEDEEPRVIRERKERIALAVTEFTGKNVSPEDASIVSYFLRTSLVKYKAYNVVDKSNMNKILEEAAFQMTGITDPETAVQIGKILNVKQLVTGYVSKLDKTYHINVNLIDVETGQILESYDRETDSVDLFKPICETIARKISR